MIHAILRHRMIVGSKHDPGVVPGLIEGSGEVSRCTFAMSCQCMDTKIADVFVSDFSRNNMWWLQFMESHANI